MARPWTLAKGGGVSLAGRASAARDAEVDVIVLVVADPGLVLAEADAELGELGAGRRLMQALLDHVQAHPSIQMLTLTVTEGNAGAIRLYESMGFQAFGTEPMAIFTGDGYKAKVHMARRR